MDEIMKSEICGLILLITGMIMVLIWAYFKLEWLSALFGFLALFCLIEANSKKGRISKTVSFLIA